MTDEAVVKLAIEDVGGLLDIDPNAVVDTTLVRWNNSFPQQRPGHSLLVEQIDNNMASEAPGVLLAGASFRGLGLPACVRDATRVALAIGAGIATERVDS
jgi:oxygen-dependent protoporphyrinogen oxidase